MIISFGNIVADVLARTFDEIPADGHLTKIDEIRLSTGGCAGNTAVVLARIGEAVALIGGVGNDNFGRFLMGEFKIAGVITDGIKGIEDSRTSACIVCVRESGERSFVTHHGISSIFVPEHIEWDVVKRGTHFHFGGFNTLLRIVGDTAADVLKRVKGLGLTTSLDTAVVHVCKWMEDLRASLPFVDYFMTNRFEGFCLTGEKEPEKIAKVLHDNGARTVIVKLDRDGSFVSSNEVAAHVPAFPAKVIDATGAGDAFAAGFIHGLSKKLPILDCCRLGNAFGAACIGTLGATDGIQSFADIERFLKR